ncbi:MAG: flagellar basal body rod C-terminal domain-containing protein, partial [Pseudomonadota bacterium]|nr:flagellar basal body rod C-terminal domain-containing protein [Pseudomonadota bacterium]
MGTTFLGGGSQVDLIQRIHAEYIQSQLNTTNSNVERYSNQFQMSTQVEGIVASNDDGIQEFMQRFFDAMQFLADNPTSSTNRQLLLDEAGNLESHVNNMSTILDETQFQVNQQVSDLTQEVNTRLELIQTINTQVSRSLSSGTQPPNDLLDQRDQAILELSSYIDIRTHLQDDGRIDVHTANGRLPLISDNTLTKLEADLGPYRDENRVEVYMSIGDQREVISEYITGGALGGVLDFRDNMLDKAQNDLGVTLNALTASVNWQHYQGWDLNGDAGQEFFAPLDTDAVGHIENQGTEDGSGIIVSFRPHIEDPVYPGAGAINTPGSFPPYTNVVGPGISDQPVDMETKEANLNGAYAVVSQMASNEYELKALDNNGDGSVDRYEIYVKGTNVPLLDTSTGENFIDGSFATIEGITIEIPNGVRANIEPGDKFLIQPHKAVLSDFEKVIEEADEIAARGQSPIDTDGDGDLGNEEPAPDAYGSNVNMANMASLFTKKLMFSDGNGQPSETIMGGYSTMASNVGMYVRGSEVQLTAQENVHQQIMTQRESISGVSLDEEAANLMRFQQAYEAAAQIIATSQSIFQTLLGAVRG